MMKVATMMARFTSYVNAVLDRADRMPWLPLAAGFTLGGGIRFVLIHPHPWGWAILGAGLVLAAVKPLGTSLRNKYRLREAKRLLAEAHEGNLFSMLAALGKLDQVEHSLGIRREADR
jgi:hypothetical protein